MPAAGDSSSPNGSGVNQPLISGELLFNGLGVLAGLDTERERGEGPGLRDPDEAGLFADFITVDFTSTSATAIGGGVVEGGVGRLADGSPATSPNYTYDGATSIVGTITSTSPSSATFAIVGNAQGQYGTFAITSTTSNVATVTFSLYPEGHPLYDNVNSLSHGQQVTDNFQVRVTLANGQSEVVNMSFNTTGTNDLPELQFNQYGFEDFYPDYGTDGSPLLPEGGDPNDFIKENIGDLLSETEFVTRDSPGYDDLLNQIISSKGENLKDILSDYIKGQNNYDDIKSRFESFLENESDLYNFEDFKNLQSHIDQALGNKLELNNDYDYFGFAKATDVDTNDVQLTFFVSTDTKHDELNGDDNDSPNDDLPLTGLTTTVHGKYGTFEIYEQTDTEIANNTIQFVYTPQSEPIKDDYDTEAEYLAAKERYDSFRSLASGDYEQETFYVYAKDTFGSWVAKPVTVNIMGTNEAPVLSVSSLQADLVELGVNNTPGILSADPYVEESQGTIVFSDSSDDAGSHYLKVGNIDIKFTDNTTEKKYYIKEDNDGKLYLEEVPENAAADLPKEALALVAFTKNANNIQFDYTIHLNNDNPTVNNLADGKTLQLPSVVVSDGGQESAEYSLGTITGDNEIKITNNSFNTSNNTYVEYAKPVDGYINFHSVEDLDGSMLTIEGVEYTISWSGTEYILTGDNQVTTDAHHGNLSNIKLEGSSPTELLADPANNGSFKLSFSYTQTKEGTSPVNDVFEFSIKSGDGGTNYTPLNGTIKVNIGDDAPYFAYKDEDNTNIYNVYEAGIDGGSKGQDGPSFSESKWVTLDFGVDGMKGNAFKDAFEWDLDAIKKQGLETTDGEKILWREADNDSNTLIGYYEDDKGVEIPVIKVSFGSGDSTIPNEYKFVAQLLESVKNTNGEAISLELAFKATDGDDSFIKESIILNINDDKINFSEPTVKIFDHQDAGLIPSIEIPYAAADEIASVDSLTIGGKSYTAGDTFTYNGVELTLSRIDSSQGFIAKDESNVKYFTIQVHEDHDLIVFYQFKDLAGGEITLNVKDGDGSTNSVAIQPQEILAINEISASNKKESNYVFSETMVNNANVDLHEGDDLFIVSAAETVVAMRKSTVDLGAGEDTAHLTGQHGMHAVKNADNTLNAANDNDTIIIDATTNAMNAIEGGVNTILAGAGDDDVTLEANVRAMRADGTGSENKIELEKGADSLYIEGDLIADGGGVNFISGGQDNDFIWIDGRFIAEDGGKNTIDGGKDDDLIKLTNSGLTLKDVFIDGGNGTTDGTDDMDVLLVNAGNLQAVKDGIINNTIQDIEVAIAGDVKGENVDEVLENAGAKDEDGNWTLTLKDGWSPVKEETLNNIKYTEYTKTEEGETITLIVQSGLI